MTEPSIFTRIASGEIPANILYEDPECFVILTHEPINPGHLMVIPREEVDHVWDIEDELYTHLMLVAKKMALKMRQVYDYKRIGMLVEGFGVPHAHIHVFGFNEPLEPTITSHIANKKIMSPDQLQFEADKLTSQQ